MNVASTAAIALFVLSQSASPSVSGSRTALAETIISRDDAFTRAYNRCATTRLRTMFAVSAEVVASGQGATGRVGEVIDNIRRNQCGRLRRVVDPASIEVYPLPGYGALQFGRERYCPTDDACDSASSRYLMIWRRLDDDWKIARMVLF